MIRVIQRNNEDGQLIIEVVGEPEPQLRSCEDLFTSAGKQALIDISESAS